MSTDQRRWHATNGTWYWPTLHTYRPVGLGSRGRLLHDIVFMAITISASVTIKANNYSNIPKPPLQQRGVSWDLNVPALSPNDDGDVDPNAADTSRPLALNRGASVPVTTKSGKGYVHTEWSTPGRNRTWCCHSWRRGFGIWWYL